MFRYTSSPRRLRSRSDRSDRRRRTLRPLAPAERPARRRLTFESLEHRHVLSVFYDFELLAQTGGTTADGQTINIIDPQVSINDRGQVAFVADLGATGDAVLASSGTAAPTVISTTLTGDFGPPQINDSGDIVAILDASGTSTLTVWSAQDPGLYDLAIQEGDAGPAGLFGEFTQASLANDAEIAFLAFGGGAKPDLYYTSHIGTNTEFVTLLAGTDDRPSAASGRTAVIADGNAITVWQDLLGFSSTPIATVGSGGWTRLGSRPAISDDGLIVVFTGERGNGWGVFAAVDVNGLGSFTIERIAGENTRPTGSTPDLGFDADGNERFLDLPDPATPAAASNYDTPVSVTRLGSGSGTTAFNGDSFVVSFLGRPNGAGAANPQTGSPLLFSDEKGLWTVRVDVERELLGSVMKFHPTSPLPVAQIGDRIGGDLVTDITVYDALGRGTRTTSGQTRTPGRGDHYLAFVAATAAGDKLVRAAHFDTDSDGLLDHWERSGGGIDMDQDGTVDLNLSAMGADPNHADLFLELDWLATFDGVSYEPPAGVTTSLVKMFADAPVTNPDGRSGITLHIDAGSGRTTLLGFQSQNMGAGPLDGGDAVQGIDANPRTGAAADPTGHVDVLFLGREETRGFDGVRMRSVGDVKQEFFGTGDKFARELAFHYVVFGDAHSFRPEGGGTIAAGSTTTTLNVTGTSSVALLSPSSLVGDAILFSNGNLAGQMREVASNNGTTLTFTDAWPTAPAAGDGFTSVRRGQVGAGTTTSQVVTGTSWITGAAANAFYGSVILMTSGTEAGKSRQIASSSGGTFTLDADWATAPASGDTFVILHGSSGRGEVAFQSAPDNDGVPGNDVAITMRGFGRNSVSDFRSLGTTTILANQFFQWRTLAHELGHSLGLRHCGTDTNYATCESTPAAYESLMSYAHQVDANSSVESFSDSFDTTFDDWSNLELDFANHFVHVGNTFGLGPLGASVDLDDELSPVDYVALYGSPFDTTPPTLDTVEYSAGSPLADGDDVMKNRTLTFQVTSASTDVAAVWAWFDLDGDGTVEDDEATFGEYDAGENAYLVAFDDEIGGDVETRTLTVAVYDASGNYDADAIDLDVTHDLSLLAELFDDLGDALHDALPTLSSIGSAVSRNVDLPFLSVDLSDVIDFSATFSSVTDFLFGAAAVDADTTPTFPVAAGSSFLLSVGGDDAVRVELAATSNDLTALVANVNTALATAGVGDLVDAVASGTKLGFQAIGAQPARLLDLYALQLTAGSAAATYGQLATDLEFDLTLTVDGAPSVTTVSVSADDTADNVLVSDLVDDLNDALVLALEFDVAAFLTSGDRIVFGALDPEVTAVKVDNVTSGSLGDLGFASGNTATAAVSAFGFQSLEAIAELAFPTLDDFDDALRDAINDALGAVVVSNVNFTYDTPTDTAFFDFTLSKTYTETVDLDLLDEGIDLGLLGTLEIAAVAEATFAADVDLTFRLGVYLGELGLGVSFDEDSLLSTLNAGAGVDVLVGTTAANDAPSDGQLGHDVTITIELTREDAAHNSAHTITLFELPSSGDPDRPATNDNFDVASLVSDLNASLPAVLVGVVEFGQDDATGHDRITLRAIQPADGAASPIRGLRQTGGESLGFATGQEGNWADVRVSLDNGATYTEVDLDGVRTVDDVIDRLEASVSGLAIEINFDGNGFNVAGSGSTPVLVEAAEPVAGFTSTAAVMLGIVNAASTTTGDTETTVDGNELHGQSLSDRVFLVESSTDFSVSVTLDATLDATAALGCLQLHAGTASGAPFHIEIGLNAGLTDPDGDGNIYLREIYESPGTVFDLSAITPTASASGTVELSGTSSGGDDLLTESAGSASTTLLGASLTWSLTDGFHFEATDVPTFDEILGQFQQVCLADVLGLLENLALELQDADLGALNVEIPVVGVSVNDLIDFGASLLDVVTDFVVDIDLDGLDLRFDAIETAIANLSLNADAKLPLLDFVVRLRGIAAEPEQAPGESDAAFDLRLDDWNLRLPARLLAGGGQLGQLVLDVPSGTIGLADLNLALDGLGDLLPSWNTFEVRLEAALEAELNVGTGDALDVHFGFVDYDATTRAAVIGLTWTKDDLVDLAFEPELPVSADFGPIEVNLDTDLHLVGGGTLALGLGVTLASSPTLFVIADPPTSGTFFDDDLIQTRLNLNLGFQGTGEATVSFGSFDLVDADVTLELLNAVQEGPLTVSGSAVTLSAAPLQGDERFVVVIDQAGNRVSVDAFELSGATLTFSGTPPTTVTVEYQTATTPGSSPDVATDAADRAQLDVTFDSTTTLTNSIGAIALSELLTNASLDVVGMVTGDLDVSFLGNTAENGVTLAVGLNHLSRPQLETDADALASLFTNLDFDLKTIVSGISAFLELLEDGLKSDVVSKLPVIGDGLDSAGTFLGRLNDDVVIPFRDFLCDVGGTLDEVAITVEEWLFEKLGNGAALGSMGTYPDGSPKPSRVLAAGLNLLTDTADVTSPFHDGTVDLDDVQVALTEDDFSIAVSVGGSDTFELDFDTGLSGLPIDAGGQGGVELTLGYALALGFGVSRDTGFYFLTNASSAPEIAVTASAALDVQGTAGNYVPTSLTLDLFGLELSATDNINESTGAAGTYVSASIGLDVVPTSGQKLPLSDLGSRDLSDVFGITLAGAANVDLVLSAGINSNLPSIQTELTAGCSVTYDLLDNQLDTSCTSLGFKNTGINLGDFLSEQVGSVIDSINEYLEPIKPVIEILTTEIPGVSDLSEAAGKGAITLLDLALIQNPDAAPAAKAFVAALQTIIEIAGSLESADEGSVIFTLMDDFNLLGGGGDPNDTNFAANVDTSGGTGAHDSGASTGVIGSLLQQIEELGINLHFLEPSNIFAMLLGQPFDVISYELPRFELGFEYEQKFPVWTPPPITIELGFGVGVFADLSVGYDSHGLDTGNFFDGFYFGDRADVFVGEDIDEFGLSFNASLAALLDLLVASAGVQGEIQADIGANWRDQDDDGKMHLDEIGSILDTDGIECLFDLHGELRALVKLVWEVLGAEGSHTLVDVLLFSFQNECPTFELGHVAEAGESLPDGTVSLAGDLILHAGAFAGQRGPGSSDTAEAFTVTKLATGVFGVAGLGLESRYAGVSRIFFDGGAHNDALYLVDVDVPVVAYGGAGNDKLEGGPDADTLDGGDGEDTLAGRGGSDTLLGGSGADLIYGFYTGVFHDGDDASEGGTDAADTIDGGSGNDEIHGEDGGDTIEGGSGDDEIYGDEAGGTGADTVYGDNDDGSGTGHDTIYVYGGNDVVHAGAGNDFVYAADGDDDVWGDAGSDFLLGDAGSDELHGGSGSDFVSGGYGADTLYGDDGNDLLAGDLPDAGVDAGDETLDYQRDLVEAMFGVTNAFVADLDPGAGSVGGDTLWGGLGNDLLIGDGGDDTLYGGWGDDALLVHLILDDSTTFAEYVEGNANDDFICGGSGADEIYGGTHSDAGVADYLAESGGATYGGFTLTACDETPTFETTATASVAGVVFDDEDGDGVRDSDENGLAGWTVSVLDSTGAVVDTATTGADGSYTIDGLEYGTYTVQQTDQTSAGWTQTAPSPVDTHTVTLAPGGEATDLDFGNDLVGATITGVKYHDVDGDGVRATDADGIVDVFSEIGIDGWQIELYDEHGTLVATTLTTSIDLDNDGTIDPLTESGWYEFTELPEGDYRVVEVPVANWVQTEPKLNDADGVLALADDGFSKTRTDAIVYGVTSAVAAVQVAVSLEHDTLSELSAFLVAPDGTRVALFDAIGGEQADLLDVTFNDSFATGIADISEPHGTTYKPAGSLADFAGLDPNGVWTLELTDNEDGTAGTLRYWTLAITLADSSIVTASGGYANPFRPEQAVAYEVTATNGATYAGRDFGNYRTAKILGRKFVDRDGNGARDAGEPGLGGVTIYVDVNDNGQHDRYEPSTVTAADGSFAITPVAPGGYKVREVTPPRYRQTRPAPSGGLPGGYSVKIASNETKAGLLFGNEPRGEIHGTKWVDQDGDGIRDDGEPGLARVVIYVDANDNGHLDPNESYTRTMADDPATIGVDETGMYWLTDLPVGRHIVREVTPPGFVQTSAGQIVFPAEVPSGLRGNQTIEAVATGLPAHSELIVSFDLTIVGSWDGNGFAPSIPADRFRAVLDGGLLPGEFELLSTTFSRTDDFPQAFPDGGENAANAGAERTTATATRYRLAFRSPHAGPEARMRLSAAGLSDTGEIGPGEFLEQWRVTSVQFGVPLDHHVVTLGARDIAEGIDFGNYPRQGGVHGTKWLDRDGDGIRRCGSLTIAGQTGSTEPAPQCDEPGVAGVTIYADVNDNRRLDIGEPSTTTMSDDPKTEADETGKYWLDGLLPGHYVIREVLPAGQVQTTAGTTVVYANAFDAETVGPEWSTERTEATPVHDERFLGLFDNESVRLSLAGLAPHDEITVSFDLLVVGSWDGDHPTQGPDRWTLKIDGGPGETAPTLLDTTFSNNTNVFPTWQNPVDSDDVDGNGMVTPLDAIKLIFRLNFGGSRQLDTPTLQTTNIEFLDVSNDGLLTPLDAIRVINRLNFPRAAAPRGTDYYPQSFPQNIGQGQFQPQAFATDVNRLGYGAFGTTRIDATHQPQDAVYHLTFTFPHTADTLQIDFAALGLRNLEKLDVEKWGLDNVVVTMPSDGHAVTIRPGETIERAHFGNRPTQPQGSVDFGDLPEPFPTRFAQDGARHRIVQGIQLGRAIDAESDGQPSTLAVGDDFAGTPDDEDGVRFVSAVVPGGKFEYEVTATTEGYLNAWFDLNGDGDFNEPGEQVALDQPLKSGDTRLDLTLPRSLPTSFGTRFRFSTQRHLLPTGPAENGEVEDYVLQIAASGPMPAGEMLGAEAVRRESPGVGALDVAEPDGSRRAATSDAIPSTAEPEPDAELSGVVYFDANRNGVQDAGENGIRDVTVFLDLNGNGTLDGEDLSTRSSDNDAATPENELGRFTIKVANPPMTTLTLRAVAPPGHQFTVPANGILEVSLANGSIEGRNFGLLPVGDLLGHKWRDDNGNGVRDGNEPGLAGVTIYLDDNRNGSFDEGEPSVVTESDDPETVSDETGRFFFDDVRAGRTVTIREVVPSGYRLTFPSTGAHERQLDAGRVVDQIFFGNAPETPPGNEIHGLKFRDDNGNGRRDLNEPGLPGVTIYVDANENGQLDDNEIRTVTMDDLPATTPNERGMYWLTGLPKPPPGTTAPATYVVREIVPANHRQTFPGVAAGGRHTIVMTGQTTVAFDVDFGNQPLGTIEGTKWRDDNANGQFEPNEPGLGGVMIYVDLDDDGVKDAGEPTATTQFDEPETPNANETGRYRITGVVPGSVVVREVVPLGFVQTAPQSGAHRLTVSGGFVSPNVNFGNEPRGKSSIHGRKWNDRNANGRDDDEPGVAGVTIYADADNDGQLDPNEPQTQTMSDGSYWLENVPAGRFVIREVVPAGWVQTFPTDEPYVVSIPAAPAFANIEGLDFGNHDASGTIYGTKYDDAYGDFGKVDSDENGTDSPVAGVTVYVDLNDNGSFDAGEPNAVTGADGTYTITDVPPGTFEVREVLPEGWGQSSPTTGGHEVTLGIGDAVREVDFLNYEIIAIEDGDDVVFAGSGADSVWGDNLLSDPRQISVGTRRDQLHGDEDADEIFGQEEDDELEGGTGVDTLDGGENDDATPDADRVLQTTDNDQTLLDASLSDGSEIDVLVNIEHATLTGLSGDNTIDADAFTQGAVILIGGGGADVLLATAFDDELDGGDGDDTLTAGGGKDTLDGGLGSDRLDGGADDDTFVFLSAAGASVDETDLLTDSAGTETLDFSGQPASDPITLVMGADAAGVSVHRSLDFVDPAQFEIVIGTAGDDSIIGSAADNTIYGRGGDDTLDGGAGRDDLYGESGQDDVSGGPDDDTLHFEEGFTAGESAHGGAGNDTFDLSLVPDDLAFLFAASGTHTASDGVATLTFTGIETLMSGSGDDEFAFEDTATFGGTIDAAAGTDTLDYAAYAAGVSVDLSAGSATGTASIAHFEHVLGGSGGDTLLGDAGENELTGHGGNDTLDGRGGDDTLDGGAGSDTLTGGADDDTFVFDDAVGSEADIVGESAGGGTDTLDFSAVSGAGIVLNLASDSLIASGARTLATASAGQFANFEIAIATALADTLTPNGSNNVLTLGAGDDTVRFDPAVTGSVSLRESTAESSSEDLLDFSQFVTGVTFDLSAATNVVGGLTVRLQDALGADGPAAYEDLTGGSGNDVLTGNDRANVLDGGAGNDELAGGRGNDVLLGGEGNDDLTGGVGNDTYVFADSTTPQTDTLHEDAGFVSAMTGAVSPGGVDVLDFAALTVPVTVNLTTSVQTFGVFTLHLQDSAGAADASEFENVFGSTTAANVLTGNAGDNLLVGGSAGDTLSGGDGADILLGQAGADTLNGNAARDLLFGGNDSDTLNGGAGEDVLLGSSTIYDAPLDEAALDALRLAWRSEKSYAARTTDLPTDDGVDDVYNLAVDKLLADGTDTDDLFGDADSDLFLGLAGEPQDQVLGEVLAADR